MTFNLTLCFLFITIIFNCFSPIDSTLQFVNVVLRHGDRTPLPQYEMYPNDPHKNHTFDPPGYGLLTQSGEIRASKLGVNLWKQYSEFLGNDYVQGSIEARSTDSNRTKESLNLLLKALYPNNIIEYTYQPLLNDTLLYPSLCKLYSEKYYQVLNMTEVKRYVAQFNVFMQYLSLWTGKKIESLLDVALISGTLDIERYMGLELPEWTKDVYPDGDMRIVVNAYYKIMNYDVEIRRRNGGMLIRKFTEDMDAVRYGTMDKKRKLMLYSTHDLTVAAVLNALKVYHLHAPQFSSAVIVELHLIDKVYYVKVLYYLGDPEKTIELQIPNCNLLCPLDQFKNLTKEIIPSDFEYNCGNV
ncbi:venom acid phosphatase Acph-1-like [Leptopilina boulardi]|uniref:venom acid phosphatase Acph-1-like n=1 Tax=Leptopilina boulardi TaxID=63433 RepID=UPI0021F608D2|nr:venom acid phosphatase Acph-1-like [Leptopilina boulardi]